MIPGVRVGHATDAIGLTGCTVILPDAPAVGGLDIRGRAAGVHGIEFLDPRHIAPHVDAVLLAGGSAFGLEAIWGVMEALEARGRGFAVGKTVVPHVAGAIIFDLNVGDHRARPDRAMGYAACVAAHAGSVEEGSVGAGTGATVGKLFGVERAMRGGLGCACVDVNGVVVAALMVVNAVGDVRDPDTGRLIAGARDSAAGTELVDTASALEAGAVLPRFGPVNTTIGVIATNASLGKAEAARLTRRGFDGFERTLSPPHLPTDGDALFCLSVGEALMEPDALGAAAAEAVAIAITRAVRLATSLPGLPSAGDLGL